MQYTNNIQNHYITWHIDGIDESIVERLPSFGATSNNLKETNLVSFLMDHIDIYGTSSGGIYIDSVNKNNAHVHATILNHNNIYEYISSRKIFKSLSFKDKEEIEFDDVELFHSLVDSKWYKLELRNRTRFNEYRGRCSEDEKFDMVSYNFAWEYDCAPEWITKMITITEIYHYEKNGKSGSWKVCIYIEDPTTKEE